MNLLGKFTLALLACGLAPLLLGTLFTHTIAKRALSQTGGQAKEALEEKTRDHVTAMVRAEGEHLNTFIRGITNETQILSRTGRLGALLESNAFYDYANELAMENERGAMREALHTAYQMHFTGRTDLPLREALVEYLDTLSDNAVAAQLRYWAPGVMPDLPPFDLGRSARYDDFHRQLDFFWPAAMEHLGYLDMLLVDGERGDVIYSMRRATDFGASLRTGPLAGTSAARAFQRVWENEGNDLVFEDVAPYGPAGTQPVCIIGAPVHVGAEKSGVALFILSLARFDAILNTSAPLVGGEAMYLVGPDYRPRSNIQALEAPVDETDVPADLSRLDIKPARVVFNLGETGSGIFADPSGHEALIAYAPVDILGVTWALIAQVDTMVAFAAVREMEASSEFFINRILYFSDFIVIAAILVLCFVADFMAKPIVRPLRTTIGILQDMVQGEDALNRRLVVRGKDEVSQLANSFNRFMDKLQLLYGSLEKEIAHRKTAQEEVERSQQYYKALIENAPDVIVVLDLDHCPLFVSPAFQRTFGYTPEEVLGKSLRDKVHPDDIGLLAEVIRDARENPNQPVRTEYRLLHKDGRWVDVATIGTNHIEDGNIAGIVVNMRDITRRKVADRVLREYNATLERDVAERTTELQRNRDELEETLEELRNAQDQLVLNEKMASLGALTAGIAHEIKNPLNFVTNFADLTAELADELTAEFEPIRDLVSEDTRANILELLHDIQQNSRKIEEHGKRADSIVKSMLLHSRGKKDEHQLTDINTLLEEYVQLSYHGMRAQDSRFNIELDVDLAPNLPRINVVPQDLARVFLNILNNGCYAAHHRKLEEGDGFQPKLTVRTALDESRVIIQIRDNGNGIPQQVRDKIFNPFFTTKPAGEGTGLGLSISYDIVVQEHHGELRLESEPGVYTEFQILLPLPSP